MALKGASALVARSPTPPSSLPPHARTARATAPRSFYPPQVSRQLAFFNAARSTRDPGFSPHSCAGGARAPTLTPPTLSSTAACNGDIWTWKQYYADTIKCAKALMHLGLNRFESSPSSASTPRVALCQQRRHRRRRFRRGHLHHQRAPGVQVHRRALLRARRCGGGPEAAG